MAQAVAIEPTSGSSQPPVDASPVEVEHVPTSTGLDSRKLLMWAFLASDCMFFGSLIATYLVYKSRALVGPYPREIFDIPYTSVSAFVLLLSSLTMVLALDSLKRGRVRGMQAWLLCTALLGALFLAGQFYEFTTFFREGLTLSTNIFGATFFVLTGFHGTHVAIGVFWLLSLVVHSMRGRITPANALTVEIAGLYWHFVDIVWILIFTLVYLLPE